MGETLPASLTRDDSARERRKKTRKPVLDVSMVTVDIKPPGFGLLLDVSDEGMGVQVMQFVEPNTPVEIGFQIPELSTRIEGTGVITWSDGEGRAGVRFKQLTSGTAADLQRWVDSTLSKSQFEDPVHALPETPAAELPTAEVPIAEVPAHDTSPSALPIETSVIAKEVERSTVAPVVFPQDGKADPVETPVLVPIVNTTAVASAVEPPTTLLDRFRAIKRQLASANFNPDAVLQTLVETVVELTRSNGGALALGTTDEMMCRASSGLAPEVGVRISSSSALSSECIHTGKVVHCEDTETDLRVDKEICRELNLRSLLIMPILHKGEVHGLLEIFSPHPKAFNAQHQALLQELADFAAEMYATSLPTAEPLASQAQPAPSKTVPPNSTTTEPTKTATPAASSSAPFVATPAPPKIVVKPAPPVMPAHATPPASTPAFSGAAASAAPAKSSPVPQIKPTVPVTRPVVPSGRIKKDATVVSGKNGTGAAPAKIETKPLPVAMTPDISETEAEVETASPHTRRSVIAVLLVVAVLISLAALGWWYGVRVSRQTAPPPAPQQIAAPPQTNSSAPLPSATGTSPTTTSTTTAQSANRTRDTETKVEAEDTVRQHGKTSTTASSTPIVISSGQSAKREETPIVAPAVTNLPANASLGNVNLPGFTSTPALRAASNVTGGQLLQRVEPTYPAFARTQRYQGDVVLAVKITKTGTVENIRRVSGNPMLSAAAIEAVKRWKYEPYRLNGQAQEIDTTVTVKFKLPK